MLAQSFDYFWQWYCKSIEIKTNRSIQQLTQDWILGKVQEPLQLGWWTQQLSLFFHDNIGILLKFQNRNEPEQYPFISIVFKHRKLNWKLIEDTDYWYNWVLYIFSKQIWSTPVLNAKNLDIKIKGLFFITLVLLSHIWCWLSLLTIFGSDI